MTATCHPVTQDPAEERIARISTSRMLASVAIMVTSTKVSSLSRSFKKLLAGKNFIFLATVNSDGTPQVTPNWVDTDGEYVLINTALGRTKTRNVERDPRVTAAISPLQNPYTYTLLRGRVVERVTGKEAEVHADRLSKKYTGKSRKRIPNQERVILKIRPERVVTPQ